MVCFAALAAFFCWRVQKHALRRRRRCAAFGFSLLLSLSHLVALPIDPTSAHLLLAHLIISSPRGLLACRALWTGRGKAGPACAAHIDRRITLIVCVMRLLAGIECVRESVVVGGMKEESTAEP